MSDINNKFYCVRFGTQSHGKGFALIAMDSNTSMSDIDDFLNNNGNLKNIDTYRYIDAFEVCNSWAQNTQIISETNDNTIVINGPRGEQGPKGDNGKSVEVDEIDNGIIVKYDNKSYQITNGRDGQNGQNGRDGQNGSKGDKGDRGPQGEPGHVFTMGEDGEIDSGEILLQKNRTFNYKSLHGYPRELYITLQIEDMDNDLLNYWCIRFFVPREGYQSINICPDDGSYKVAVNRSLDNLIPNSIYELRFEDTRMEIEEDNQTKKIISFNCRKLS